MNNYYTDKIRQLNSLRIYVLYGFDSNELSLKRGNITIPYNRDVFMLLSVDSLMDDILNQFRKNQMIISVDKCKKERLSIKQHHIELLSQKKNIKLQLTNNKKKNIRNILYTKGLCSNTN